MFCRIVCSKINTFLVLFTDMLNKGVLHNRCALFDSQNKFYVLCSLQMAKGPESLKIKQLSCCRFGSEHECQLCTFTTREVLD